MSPMPAFDPKGLEKAASDAHYSRCHYMSESHYSRMSVDVCMDATSKEGCGNYPPSWVAFIIISGHVHVHFGSSLDRRIEQIVKSLH